MSLDFGFLGPVETSSSDEEMYTGARPNISPEPVTVDSAQTSRFKYQKLPSPSRRKLYQVGQDNEHQDLVAQILTACWLYYRCLQRGRPSLMTMRPVFIKVGYIYIFN